MRASSCNLAHKRTSPSAVRAGRRYHCTIMHEPQCLQGRISIMWRRYPAPYPGPGPKGHTLVRQPAGPSMVMCSLRRRPTRSGSRASIEEHCCIMPTVGSFIQTVRFQQWTSTALVPLLKHEGTRRSTRGFLEVSAWTWKTRVWKWTEPVIGLCIAQKDGSGTST